MVIGTYGINPVYVMGDGTLRYVEDGWTACMRASSPPTPVPRQEVVYRLDGGTMIEHSRTDTAALQHCDQLAACPFVDVMGDEGPRRVGEILRNLRGVEAYTHQSLDLDASSAPLELRISEEKAEVTFIDALWVEIDGQHLWPSECGQSPLPGFCAVDGEMFVLREGESIALDFDRAGSGAAVLHAIGYYTPTPMGCF